MGETHTIIGKTRIERTLVLKQRQSSCEWRTQFQMSKKLCWEKLRISDTVMESSSFKQKIKIQLQSLLALWSPGELKRLTLRFVMLKNGQTCFKNHTVWILQDFQSTLLYIILGKILPSFALCCFKAVPSWQ